MRSYIIYRCLLLPLLCFLTPRLPVQHDYSTPLILCIQTRNNREPSTMTTLAHVPYLSLGVSCRLVLSQYKCKTAAKAQLIAIVKRVEKNANLFITSFSHAYLMAMRCVAKQLLQPSPQYHKLRIKPAVSGVTSSSSNFSHQRYYTQLFCVFHFEASHLRKRPYCCAMSVLMPTNFFMLRKLTNII